VDGTGLEPEDTRAEVADLEWCASWAQGRKPSRHLIGSSELGKLEKLIREAADRQPVVYFSQPAFRKLQAGNDAQDVDGNPLTFDNADALFKRRKLKVQRTPPSQRRESAARGYAFDA
jgi:hypothetical protein